MNTRKTGAEYEALAEQYLQSQGIKIIERNYRKRNGEIDLIGKNQEYLIFFEVKYRKTDAYGGALQAVSYYKQKKICRCADYYCIIHPWIQQIRYDVVGITDTRIEWIKNAFSHIGYHWK